jgi:general secretion pathway protein D
MLGARRPGGYCPGNPPPLQPADDRNSAALQSFVERHENRDQRKINSSIAIQSGEAVVLGGLIRDNKSVNTTGIPLLSDIPQVGEVFKTHNNQLQRTELIVFITPKVVWNQSDARDATDEVRSKMQGIYGRR